MKKIIMGLMLSMAVIISAHATDFKWINNQGDIHVLSHDYKNKPVVVHIWASWCGPFGLKCLTCPHGSKNILK
ncbi:MAG: hypothetical protein Q9M11_07305 [Mariprofundaceae bacterium]|nr:hypothetical protein [Mariprofundaceae bacterium]